jgi:hypothetical protein
MKIYLSYREQAAYSSDLVQELLAKNKRFHAVHQVCSMATIGNGFSEWFLSAFGVGIDGSK